MAEDPDRLLRERINAALVGSYELTDELGQGGMAIVFLARDIKHERTVAIKVLRPEIASHVGCERFLKEIKTRLGFLGRSITHNNANSFVEYVQTGM